MKKILDYLEQLDFSSIEAKLYLIVLQSGPMTVQDLAKAARINRTAAYSPINSLLEKSVFIKITSKSRKELAAIEPDQLHYLIDRKFDSIKSMQAKFPEIINTINLSLNRKPVNEKVVVKYYQGKNGVNTIYQDSLRSLDIRTYFDAEDVDKVFPENTMKANHSVLKNPRQIIREIVRKTSTAIEDIKLAKKLGAKNHIYKFIPEDLTLTANDILIYDGKVAIINTRDINNVTGVVLHNQDYYNNSVQLFDLLWRLLPDA